MVGESGCGKSTLARMVTLIEPPTAGALTLDGKPTRSIAGGRRQAAAPHRADGVPEPYGSLNPRKTVGAILEEPLIDQHHRGDKPSGASSARAMMARVGLRPSTYGRYPHMFSGGQRQRIAIARALMLQPELVVADEPVSALDVSVQAQVLNLLIDLQGEFGLAYLFISHDLGRGAHIAHDVLVMYLGRPSSRATKERIFERPLHPYTQALLASTPALGGIKRARQMVKGEVPSPLNVPKGCVFATRCPYVTDICRSERPPLRDCDGRQVACHHAETIPAFKM